MFTRRRLQLTMAFILLLVMLVPATAANGQAATLGGAATVRTASGSPPGSNDSLVINLTGLSSIGSGFRYEGWLVKSTGEMLSVGTFTGPSANRTYISPTGENLAAEYVQFNITREPFPDPDPATAGEVRYSGTFATGVLLPFRNLLASSTVTATGNGIVPAIRGQAIVARDHAQLAQNSATLTDMQTHAQHVINVVDGLGAPGDGTGLVFLAEQARAQAEQAKAAATSTETALIAAADDAVARANRVIDRAAIAKSNAQSILDASSTNLLTEVALENLVGTSNDMVTASQNLSRATQDMGAFRPIAGPAGQLPSVGDEAVAMVAMAVLLAGVVLTGGGVMVLRRRQAVVA